MARIEWYAETNRKLNSPLTPANRCTDKTTALQNNADPAPLADFEPNRLVPTTAGYVKLWEHLIRFKNYDGTVLQEKHVPHNSVPSYTGSTPTRTGYTFTGWSPTPVAAIADADYIAQFTVNSYTITYINNVDSQSTTRSVNYGDTAPSITPWSISGYTFDHWDKQFGTVTGDDTYTAIYTQNTVYYTVTFIVDGSTYDTQSVSAGGYASTPTAPTKSGYTFTGWSPDVASTQINGNTTFTAVFTENTPAGPSTTGIVVVQGGFDAALPWVGEPGSGYGLTDDYWPARIKLFPQAYNSTPISGRIIVTGYKYNFYTKTRTELPSECYIYFSDLCYSSSNYYSTGVTITLSDALYDQGWRLEQTVTGESGQNNHWGDTSLKTKTYHYIGSSICEIGVPGGTPEDMWFVTLSSEDANLSASLVYGVNPPYTTINGTTYSSYYITNSCYASSRDGSRTGRAYTYLDDSELPITSTGTTYADENNYVSVIVSPR